MELAVREPYCDLLDRLPLFEMMENGRAEQHRMGGR